LHYHTRAILFDLDGTLIDTTDLILQCFQHSWKKVCGFNHSRQSLLQTFGTPLRDAMHRLLLTARATSEEGHSEDLDIIDRLLAEYRSYNHANHDSLARPFEGTAEVLVELRRRGYVISVVTSKGRELGLRGLRLCALDGLIDSAIFLEDTDAHKPNPEPILAALDRLKKPADAAAYVGDSRHDIVAGRAAGVRTVAALWGPAPRIELERERPDHSAESVKDLLEIFN
jgi:pyrophosphatase PpaX